MKRIANNLRVARTVASVATMSIILAAIGCAQENKSTKKPLPAKINWPAVVPSELIARFSCGSGYEGEVFDLKGDGSFDFTHYSCTFSQKCSGQYKLESGVVVLTADGSYPSLFAKFKNSRLKPVKWRTRRLVPLAWGDRMYLIEEGGHVEFCNQVNEGWEPRNRIHGRFLLRTDDWEIPVNEKPGLPNEYTDHLIDAPCEAKVLSQKEHVLRLDKGSREGVFVGMRLAAHPKGKIAFRSSIEVVSVKQNTAVAEVRWGSWPEPGDAVFINRRSADD
ncbi:MAG: hypothetical protein DHS20C16_15940 [Phycisphaerae bacterium]|nr:MAG: hypothetical protein DHS20C16_15940 [Phycisphaerae bacterium]